MKIKYNNEMEDLVAFNLHYFDKSNAVKKVIRNSNMFCSAVITVPMTFLGYSAGHTIIFFILGAMISYLYSLRLFLCDAM